MLIVTHDLPLAARLCERAVILVRRARRGRRPVPRDPRRHRPAGRPRPRAAGGLRPRARELDATRSRGSFRLGDRGHRVADHEVVDRRRIELIEPGVSAAPIHYESHRLDVPATAALVAAARASIARAASAALDEPARPDPLDLAAGVAARLSRRHRRPAPRAVRGAGRRDHVPAGARRARARPRLGRARLRRQGGARTGRRPAGRAGRGGPGRAPRERSGRRGPRTTGSRSPRRSWRPESRQHPEPSQPSRP